MGETWKVTLIVVFFIFIFLKSLGYRATVASGTNEVVGLEGISLGDFEVFFFFSNYHWGGLGSRVVTGGCGRGSVKL